MSPFAIGPALGNGVLPEECWCYGESAEIVCTAGRSGIHGPVAEAVYQKLCPVITGAVLNENQGSGPRGLANVSIAK